MRGGGFFVSILSVCLPSFRCLYGRLVAGVLGGGG